MLATNRSARFDFNAHFKADQHRPKGHVTYRDRAAWLLLNSTEITSVIVTGSHGTIRGRGRANGVAVSFRIEVDDLSRDGDLDTFRIQLSNGYSAAGTLYRGNIRIRCGDDDGGDGDGENDDRDVDDEGITVVPGGEIVDSPIA